MKAVSVVVPCYNAAAYLDKCMDHLLRQTIGLENIEIILVDDASTDGGETWEAISRYERQFPDTIIAVSLEQNMRQGGARNVGISYASGEYLIFCDADDWLMTEALDHCYRAARGHDADMVEFLYTYETDRNGAAELIKGDRDELIVLETEEQRKQFLMGSDECLTLGSQRKCYRLSVIREQQIAFAEHLIFEEPSFTLPLRFYERRHYFLDEVLYVYYASPGSTVRGDWGEHKMDNPKVWTHLAADLEKRGFLQKYHEEMEFVFFRWEFALSIRMIMQKGYMINTEELQFLIGVLYKWFPEVVKNKYLQERKDAWDSLLLTVLNMEITDESVKVINEVLKKYV